MEAIKYADDDLSAGTIKALFNRQIREMTRRTIDSFDYQFSDRWV